MTHTFHPTVLREYDIRGIIGETLGPDDARAIGGGFGTLLRRAKDGEAATVAVGYDGRISSPMLEHALAEGLTASGCDVVRIGLGATPMLYYAEASSEEIDGGIQCRHFKCFSRIYARVNNQFEFLMHCWAK